MALNITREFSIQQRRDRLSIARYAESAYQLRRKALLPPRGSYARDIALWHAYYNDRNLMARSAFTGQVRKIQATPWEIKADADTAYWQNMLWDADLGNGWDAFLSRILIPYYRSDMGGFIEIIGPGDPSDPLIAAPIGIAALNTLNCILTGDTEYPVIYSGENGWHKLHRTRVIQVVDSLDSDFYGLFGYGDCAFGRYISAARRDETMSQYIEEFLDDKPRPGVVVFNNLSATDQESAIQRMLADMNMDDQTWGRALIFENMMPDQKVGVDYFPFAEAPEKFDYERYTELNVKLLAMAMGTDIQEIWELTGGGIGTGTQSQVLAQKAKGKSFGRLLKLLERIINQVLPRDVEFEFKFEDSQEDLERAQIEQTYANIFATISGALTPEEQRQYLANQMESVNDAMRDVESAEPRLSDADLEPVQNTADDTTEDDEVPDNEALTGERALANAFDDWTGDFVRIYNAEKNPLLSSGLVRTSFLRNVQLTGRRAYLEGMKDAGIDDPAIDSGGQRVLDRWFSEQTQYVNNLLRDFRDNDYTRAQLEERATLWQNKSFRQAYYEGVDAGTVGGAMFQWKMNPAKENCATCQRLNNQVHRYQTFKSRNLVPGSAALDCGGWQCGCDLILQPRGTRAYGNIRAVPFTHGRKEHVCTEVCTHG